MENMLKFKYNKRETEIFPEHPMVNNWLFKENEKEEAILCHAMANVAEKNGITVNSLSHIFPLVLKMLDSKSSWTK